MQTYEAVLVSNVSDYFFSFLSRSNEKVSRSNKKLYRSNEKLSHSNKIKVKWLTFLPISLATWIHFAVG